MSFDNGFDGEAERLAVSARVLLHDTRHSHSLLGQMGLLSIPFCSTAVQWDAKGQIGHHGLLQITWSTEGFSFHAPLGERHLESCRWIPFKEWWSEIVFDDRQGNNLTREGIVLELADRDGGAHVDLKLTPSYKIITKRSYFGVFNMTTGKRTPREGGHVAHLSMRQIAYELLITLAKAGYTV